MTSSIIVLILLITTTVAAADADVDEDNDQLIRRRQQQILWSTPSCVKSSLNSGEDDDHTSAPSLETNITEHHCWLQERTMSAVNRTVIKALGLETFPNQSIIDQFGRNDRTIRRVLSVEGFESDDGNGRHYKAVCSSDDGRSECNYQRQLLTTHYILKSMQVSNDTDRTLFNLEHMSKFQIKNATLFFYVNRINVTVDRVDTFSLSVSNSRQVHYRPDDKYSVHIYRYQADMDSIDTEPFVVRKRTRVSGAAGDWDSVHVKNLVTDWIDKPKNNFGIMIKASVDYEQDNNQSISDLIDRRVDHNETGIFLELEVFEKEAPTDQQPVHYRRSSLTTPDDSNNCILQSGGDQNFTCCRYPLEVDFREFGWDWIIAPRQYNAYYCAGTCHRANVKDQPQHSNIIQHTQAHNMCCSPQRMNPMKMVYLDDAGNLQTKYVPNMIVQRCGCS